jgi:hypothetical protein
LFVIEIISPFAGKYREIAREGSVSSFQDSMNDVPGVVWREEYFTPLEIANTQLFK